MSNGLFKASDVRLFGLVIVLVLGVLIGGNLYKKWEDWSIFGPSKDQVIDGQKKEIDKLIDEKKTEEDKKDVDAQAEEERKKIEQETEAKKEKEKEESEARKKDFKEKIDGIVLTKAIKTPPKKKITLEKAKSSTVSEKTLSKSDQVSEAVIDFLWDDYCQGKTNCGEQP